jgi:hypothetical protein
MVTFSLSNDTSFYQCSLQIESDFVRAFFALMFMAHELIGYIG